VAISMPELPEPTRVAVKLRQDVKFHDKPPLNGRQMTAKDIAYSFDRFRAVGQAKNLLDPVDSYEMPDDFTIDSVPARFAEHGDLHAGIDDAVFDITPLLEWADRDEAAGHETPAEQ